jgi:hypothetical protein
MNIDNAIAEFKDLLNSGISGLDLEMFGLISEDSIRTAIKCMECQVAEQLQKRKDIKDINHDLGLEEVEKKAISKILAKGKFKDTQLVEDCVKKVISSIDSMTDESTEQPPEPNPAPPIQ